MTLGKTRRDAAVEAAMDLFWRRGADRATYPEIVSATGLNRKRLYALWPEKDALVLDTLRHYRAQVLQAGLDRLSPPGAAPLLAFWDRLEAETRGRDWAGCFLMSTAAGPYGRLPAVRKLRDEWLDQLAESLTTAILAAVRDLPRSRVLDPGAAAWQAVALWALIAELGPDSGYDARIAGLLRAGRLACGLPPG
ncbi:TetR/AcrR family transcriptional regulator [Frigidibacter sp. ROC022]|uniref:TetR/AcrR family transcriptional regulator n=1 Tax=Frigidibacter sp. ROC022 TaxID=2971796 RepID=UPI00215ACC2B|nr:helix-turn-helix domain-containing protein [Frigidibacter sp. ROC022]MCR8723125.1 TetR/AcrR family transcriptional regulator [Frigidibacter sp. ROC022]